MSSDLPVAFAPGPVPPDPVPDPEPAAPSLPEPDPGVYHHEVPTRAGQTATPASAA